MSVTVVGELYTRDGLSWHMTRVDVADLRSRQETPIPLTLDHDYTHVVGKLLTLTKFGGAVYAVAVADGVDALLDAGEEIYFSPTTDTRARDNGDGRLIEAALCLCTARLCARPVELFRGDVRSSADRAGWSLRRPGLTADLIDRAADELRHRPKDAPIHVRDLEHEKWIERQNKRAPAYSYRQTEQNLGRLGLRVPPQDKPNWRPGDLEWSRAGGKILHVS